MKKVDKFKIGLGLVALALAIALLLALVFSFQETCSDYQCPDGYVKDESKKDTDCESFTCDSVDRDSCCISKQKCSEYTCPTGYKGKDNADNIYCKGSVCKESDDKDTCCNKSVNCEGRWSDFSECSVECGGGTQTRTYIVTKQPQYGGTPCPTTPESQACNTDACASGVVANATCSTVSENCPVGYLYKTNSNATCAGSQCNVEIGGIDLNTCCEQGCTSPGSLPTGYTGNLPATLSVGVGDIPGVQCAEDENYHGTPTYNCATAGEVYTVVGGCEPDMCTTPPDTTTTGYNITNVTSLQRNNFPVNVTCEDGYGPSNQGDIPRASCSGDSVDYTLTGCENKIGFCSGNTDPSNNVTCENGYKDKSDKNTIVGNTLETCCDQIITPEAQPSGTQSTELPICSQVAVANKLPETIITDIPVDNLKNCSDFCAQIPGCQYFSYSDIVSGENQHHQHQNNCILSGSSGMIDINSNNLNYLNYLNPSYVSWSFYQKCQVPLCDSIKLTGVNPNKNPILSYRANDVGTCENNCSGRDKNICNSFSFNKLPGNYRCYIYDEENLTTVNNQNFDYYPVKCQP